MKHNIFLVSILILTFFPRFLFSQDLVINEFMANNEAIFSDISGKFEDWIEIYSYSDTAIDMAGMYLTDNLLTPDLWQVPAGTPDKTTIQPGGYLLFWFDKDTEKGPLHVNAKLNSKGEQIGLFNKDLTPIDVLTYEYQEEDVSYGRAGDNSEDWIYFQVPTPLSENVIALPQAESPIFSQTSSAEDEPITLSLTAPADADIYYTVDGSLPTTTDALYLEPISIDSSMTIRAISFAPGLRPSKVITEAYLIDVHHTFPIVFLSFDPTDFYDDSTGIYTNFEEDWVRPIEVTFFETDGTVAFKQPASAQIHGGGSADLNQKSIALKSKKHNGNKNFIYPIFDDLPFEEYGSFLLRNSGQDWLYLMFRDAYGQSLVGDLSDVGGIIDKPKLLLQGYRPSIGYFNGKYYGIYNIRERLDTRFFKTHFGWKKKQYELIKNDKEVKVGNMDKWNEFMYFIDTTDMSLTENYDSLKKIMDVDGYMDYIILNVFVNNYDWPGNNIRRFREKTPEGKWHWMTFDLDYSFSLQNEDGSWNSGNYHDHALRRLHEGLDWTWPNMEWGTRPFRACIQNKVWRTTFVNHMADQLNILFDPVRLQNRMDEFVEVYEPEIMTHRCKWNDCWDSWESNVAIVENFIGGRRSEVWEHVVDQYPEITGLTSVTLTATPLEGGSIKLSTINLEENYFPWTGVYFKGVDIPIKATPALGYIFTGWSDPDLGTSQTGFLNLSQDSFNLTANFEKVTFPGILTITCPTDISLTTMSDSAMANWELPSTNSTCYLSGTIHLSQDEGTPSGSNFSIGTTSIVYSSTDTCGNAASCNFNITVLGPDAISNDTTLAKKGIKIVSVYPNPTNKNITLKLIANTGEVIQFSILDTKGKVKYLSKERLKHGINHIEFNVENFPTGVYYLKVSGPRSVETIRFIKLLKE